MATAPAGQHIRPNTNRRGVNSDVDYAALRDAICKAIVEGNKPLIDSLGYTGDKRHELRNVIESLQHKVYEHDGELRLVKGGLITLMGTGDGSTGLVNRLDSEVTSIGSDVAELKGGMKLLNAGMDTLSAEVRQLALTTAKSTSFMDGWKGVGIAITIMAAMISIVAFVLQHWKA